MRLKNFSDMIYAFNNAGYANSNFWDDIDFFSLLPVNGGNNREYIYAKDITISDTTLFCPYTDKIGLYTRLISEFPGCFVARNIARPSFPRGVEFSITQKSVNSLGHSFSYRHLENVPTVGVLCFSDKAIKDKKVRAIQGVFSSYVRNSYHRNELDTMHSILNDCCFEMFIAGVLNSINFISPEACAHYMSGKRDLKYLAKNLRCKTVQKINRDITSNTHNIWPYPGLVGTLDKVIKGRIKINVPDYVIKQGEDAFVPVESPYDKEW